MKNELQKRILSSIILLPISAFFIYQGSIYFIFFLTLLFVATSYEWIKMCKTKYIINFFGIIFLFFSFYSAFYIRENIGLLFFLFIILICIFTDIGGYVFGKVFKGPKLTKISPNKTISGSIGSVICCCTTICFLFYYFTNKFSLNLILIGILISISCQLGDIFFSILKRKSKVKDTGKFLPGHGGVLDRLDGIFIALPVGFVSLILFY